MLNNNNFFYNHQNGESNNNINNKSLAEKIRGQGEAEASQSFNTFKTASKASSYF